MAATVAAVAVGGVGAAAVLGSGDVPVSATGDQHQHGTRSVIAAPGDSLWTIAERHHDREQTSLSTSEYVDRLVELNGGASLDVGDRVLLP